MPRIVVTTSGSPHGLRVLAALERRGIRVHAVVLLAQIGVADCFAGPLPGAPRRGVLPAAGRWVWRRVAAQRLRRRLRGITSSPMIVSGAMNGARLHHDLRRLAPDVLVLGGGGILDERTIALAPLGVLNAHPSLLPWLRGNGGAGWGLLGGIAVGATLHRVNRLIDAGAIVERRLLPVHGPATLAELEEGAAQLAAEILADAVGEILRTGAMPPALEQTERHPLLRWYPPEQAREMEALARAGRAAELFARWQPLCVDTERWTLPNTDLAPPAAPLAEADAG